MEKMKPILLEAIYQDQVGILNMNAKEINEGRALKCSHATSSFDGANK